jgi:hypothetical protein
MRVALAVTLLLLWKTCFGGVIITQIDCWPEKGSDIPVFIFHPGSGYQLHWPIFSNSFNGERNCVTQDSNPHSD